MPGGNLTLQSVKSVNDLIYSYSLSSAFMSPYVYDPRIDEFREPDIWELVRNHWDLASSIDRSSKALIRPFRIMAYDGSRDKKDNQLAAVVKQGISSIERFSRRRRRIGEARIVGRTYGVMYWRKQRVSLGGMPEADWFIPYAIQDVDRRRFHWVPDWDITGKIKKGIHLEIYNTNTWTWEKIPTKLRRSMIEYVYGDTEDRVGYGRGLLIPTFFAHYLLTVTDEKISQGIDRWANGFLVGKVDALRSASVTKTSGSLATSMLNMLQNMRSQHVAVIENVDDVKLLETSGTGHAISMEFRRELVQGVERLYNGSVRPGGGGPSSNGSEAQGTVEENESESFFQEEREDLDCIIDRDVVGNFIAVNRLTIESLGLGKAKRPKFTSENVRKQDPSIAIERMNAANTKVAISRKQYYENAELEEPLGDEDQIDVAPEGQAGFGDADAQDFGVKKPDSKNGDSAKNNGNGSKKPAGRFDFVD